MNKKGALELGVSTVVVLVIAIVLIGVIISFITGLGDKLDEGVGGIEPDLLPVRPTATDPMALKANSVTVKKGDATTFEIAVYNTEPLPLKNAKLVAGMCTEDLDGEEAEMIIRGLPQTIKPGDIGAYRVKIEAGENTDPGSYICSIKAVSDEFAEDSPYMEKQLTFEVYV